jgi:hypothetical protein
MNFKLINFRFFCMIFLFIIIISNLCFSFDIKGGEIHLIRPYNNFIDFNYIPSEYVSLEDLFFYTCIEEVNVPIRSSVLCLDDISFQDVNLYRWGNSGNCYLGAYDLSKKNCRNIIIETEYEKDDEVIKISKNLKINRFSSILELVLKQQYSDGGWKNATETASGIWVLSNYRDIFKNEILLANEWLKKYRNNDLKCWPDNDCSTLETARILAYLTLANNNDDLRIMHDGIIFLKKKQSFYKENDEWNLSITPFEKGNTSCLITYDRNHLNDEEFLINENQTKQYSINVFPDEKLIVICDRNIKAILKTMQDETTFIYEGDNLSYSMPYACWPKDAKWGLCDLQTTLFALLTNIDDERKEAALKYVESVKKKGFGNEAFLKDEEKIFETSLYSLVLGNNSFNVSNNTDLIAWLRFKQNNDGSFDIGDFTQRIETTAFSILSFLKNNFSRTHQVVKDAESWINEEEIKISLNKTSEYLGWNSTQRNALAFTVLKNNARPLLKTSPIILILDKDEIELDIFNPTAFPLNDVTYDFSNDFIDLVEVKEPKDKILAYSYVKLKINRIKGDTGNVFGFLKIINENQEIARIPLLMVNYPTIDINTKKDSIVVFGTASKIDFNVVKTKHVFDCDLKWDSDEINSKSDYKINTDSFSVDISFKNPERSENTYKGNFNCIADNELFIIPFSIDVSRYSSFPFSLSTDNIIINNSNLNPWFIINNELDESIDINIRFVNSDNNFEFSVINKVIDPNKDLNVTIFNNIPPDINYTKTNTIVVEALGESRNINFKAFITDDRFKEKNKLLYYIILLIILIVIIGLAIILYFYRNKFLSFFKKENNVDKIKMRIKKLEEREKKTAIENMITIMRMLNKDENEIRKRLINEGFLEEEINKVFDSELNEENEKKEE